MRTYGLSARDEIGEGFLLMSSFSNDELKKVTLEVFGRELSDEQLEIYKGRLPTMLQNVRLLQEWGERLDQAHPAQIQYPVEAERGDKGRADD